MEYRRHTRITGFYVFIACIFIEACTSPPHLKAIKVVQAPVETTVSSTSSGTVDAKQQAVLGFSTSGRVGKINVKAGTRVRKGMILAELENLDFETVMEQVEKERERSKELFDAGLISKVGRDEATKNFEVARASYEKTVIKAPFDGVITEVNLEVGELFQGAAPTAKAPLRLIDLKPRIVRGDIDEVDLARVKLGQIARVKVLAARSQHFAAKVSRVVPFVSTTREQDRTSLIELEFTDSPELIPVGASADIEIVTASKPNTLAVPSQLVLGHGTERYVYKFVDGRIVKSPIQAGIGNYDRTEIVGGLSAGDTVVYPAENAELTDNLKVKVEIVAWP